MSKISIDIIGAGSRGLSLLERIVTLYPEYSPNQKMEIWLIDKNEAGFGVHLPNQPDYFLTNTVACQITLFGDDSVTAPGSIREGPNLYQWARDQGYKKSGQLYSRRPQGEEISPDDYLPRALLGEYLHSVYLRILHNLPPGITVNVIRGFAVQVSSFSNHTIKIKLDNDFKIKANYLFLATGHGENRSTEDDLSIQRFVSGNLHKNKLLRYIRRPYELRKYSHIAGGSNVMIGGMGLTTYDIIARLTVGCGGRFCDAGHRLIYHPSGDEPQIYIYSRQSLPAGSRGVNQKGVSGRYLAHFFTLDAIDRLRQRTAQGKIDFVADLLPLLIKEMCYVYSCVERGEWTQARDYQAGAAEREAINQLFYPHQGLTFSTLEEWRAWFKELLIKDIADAEKGNVDGALKAAADVIRDTRDILRYAINHGGLTPQSHRQFLSEFCPIFNRIAVGPPLRRNQELLALIESGVVALAGGPAARLVCRSESGHFALHTSFVQEESVTLADILIKARIATFSPASDSSRLYHNLLAEGVIRPYDNDGFPAGGIDIDRQHHVISRKKISQKNIYALGTPVEGPNYFTYVLPRPAVNSTALQEAALCVVDMYQNIRKHAGS